MKREENKEKERQENEVHPKKNTSPKNLPKQDQETIGKSTSEQEKNKPSATDSSEDPRRNRENRAEDLDEDMKAQERGSYGHKSQDEAEKDGRATK